VRCQHAASETELRRDEHLQKLQSSTRKHHSHHHRNIFEHKISEICLSLRCHKADGELNTL
jgi:hypothetical protein